MSVYLSRYLGREEIEQFVCKDAAEARVKLEELNAIAESRWHWGLSRINFLDDQGVDLTVEQANELRRDCGVAEW